MTNIFFRITATLALLLGMSCLVYAQQPVRIQVYGTHEGPNIVYHYKVINSGSAITLTNIVIGSILKDGWESDGGQLERLPLGANFINTESESGGDIQLAPTSTTQPPYWMAEMYGPGIYSLEWHILPNGGQPYAIPPGQSLGGFSVTLPLFDMREGPHEYYNAGLIVDPTTSDIDPRDDIYLRASFKAEYVDNKYNIQAMRGQLEIADTTPPTLSVTLTPSTLWPPDNKMVTVNATINVQDDYDPNPVVHIVSITANEPLGKDDVIGTGGKLTDIFTDTRQFQLKAKRAGNNLAGRIYTVTYVALDASGNQTMSSATVTVPHDQGKK